MNYFNGNNNGDEGKWRHDVLLAGAIASFISLAISIISLAIILSSVIAA